MSAAIQLLHTHPRLFVNQAHRHDAPLPAESRWTFAEIAGRLTELSGAGESASLTAAFALVREAQGAGEPAAWVTREVHSFFPPDAAAAGVALETLTVVRVGQGPAIPWAAEQLARSGAFGLLILDLGEAAEIPLPRQARLLGLARKYHTAILCLTEKRAAIPSLSSLVSLRAEVQRQRVAPGKFTCRLTALKDKRRGLGWGYEELYRGPPGLC